MSKQGGRKGPPPGAHPLKEYERGLFAFGTYLAVCLVIIGGQKFGWVPYGLILAALYVMGAGYLAWRLWGPRTSGIILPVPSLVAYSAAELGRDEEARALRQLYRQNVHLPVDKRVAKEVCRISEEEDANSELGAQLRTLLPSDITEPTVIARFWTEQGARFLEQCQYKEAAHCANFAFEACIRHPGAMLIYSICGASRGLHQVQDTLDLALTHSRDMTACWAVAWSSCLLGDTKTAEKYLHRLTRTDGRNVIWWSLLGACQKANGKVREGLTSRQRAVELATSSGQLEEEANARFGLALDLVSAGLRKEAKVEFDWLKLKRATGEIRDDFIVGVEMLSSDLSHGEVDQALKIANDLAGSYSEAKHLISLGYKLAETTDKKARDASRDYFARALSAGFYPQALIALSKMAYEDGDRTTSRGYILQSLDATRPVAKDAVYAVDMLQEAIDGLRILDHAPPGKLNVFDVWLDARDTPLGLRTLAFTCHFSNGSEALKAAHEVFAALLPSYELEEKISWKIRSEAPEGQYAATPGIHEFAWE